MSKQPPPVPTASAIGPCSTVIQISRTSRHWKFTQRLRTTRSILCFAYEYTFYIIPHTMSFYFGFEGSHVYLIAYVILFCNYLSKKTFFLAGLSDHVSYFRPKKSATVSMSSPPPFFYCFCNPFNNTRPCMNFVL